MGILDRFAAIMRSNVNALLDSMEDPAKMIDQSLIDLANNLANVKAGTAEVMGEEKRAKRALDENAAEISRYDALARQALSAGKEHDARVFLSKRQKYEDKGAELQKIYDAAHDNASKMRQMHDKLVDDIETLKSRRAMIKAKVAVAKTQDMVGSFAASSVKTETAMAAYDRMEEKADRMLDRSDSMLELNEDRRDEADILEEQYATGTHGATVDDALAKLKKEMGL